MPYLEHRETHEIIQLDTYAGRIARMRRRVHAWAKYLSPVLKDGQKYRMVMVTLTLRPEVSWKPNLIRDYMKRVRRSLKTGLVGYAWVGELQQRGAVHYHVLLILKRGTWLPYADKSGWWPWGMSKTETARTPFYITKYASKGRFINSYGDRPTLPRGMRLFAVWIVPSFTNNPEFWEFSLSKYPMWVCELMMAEFLYWTINRGVGGYDLSPPNYPEVKTHITSPWILHLT